VPEIKILCTQCKFTIEMTFVPFQEKQKMPISWGILIFS